LLSAGIPKAMSLQQAQENAQQGLHRREMEFQGLRVQSGQDLVRMQAQIPGNLEVKLDQINSQMASLWQALQSCQQNMAAISDLEALKNVWTRDVGHLSAQIKIVQTHASTVVLPQLEVLLGTEKSTKECLRRLNHQTSEETIRHMVSEALSVALGKIPPPRAELSVKALVDLKGAMEDSSRKQLRGISQRLAQLESSVFSEGNVGEGGIFSASPPIAHKSVSSRSPQPKDCAPIIPQPVEERKWA